MSAHSFIPVLALLEAQTGASQFNGSGLALIAGIIAALRRKQAIGGWLFYFFCQVGLGLMLIGVTTHWRRYLPAAWADPGQYMLFTVSNLSRIALLMVIAALSVVLLRTREWRWVAALKYALICYGFLTLLKLLVDDLWFPESQRLDLLSLAFPCVWMVYFDASRRVRWVFLDKRFFGNSQAGKLN